MQILYNVFLGDSACQVDLQPIFNYILYVHGMWDKALKLLLCVYVWLSNFLAVFVEDYSIKLYYFCITLAPL